ncbi:MAG: DUF1697 domain-containing protein [Hyphomonadaceae bacterium]|nr:DUF1697 domain-containing protein [Hyphomonadaceae bacterium]
MTVWIALLRGINVGGNNILPMKDLRALLEQAGLTQVSTYIQSGNCVFAADETDPRALERSIAAAIDARFGFRPQILVMRAKTFQQALAANPYPEGAEDPKTVHFFFLAEPAAGADLAAMEDLRAGTERFALTDRVFYLHAPDGIGRSKLAAKVERHLGVATTARNLRSVMKLAELAG